MARLSAAKAGRVGGFLRAANEKRPLPLTPPRHSLREWGEGNPTALPCSKKLPKHMHFNAAPLADPRRFLHNIA